MERFFTETSRPQISVLTLKTADEEVALAINIEHGLTAHIFSCDMPKDNKLARPIESASCYINTVPIYDQSYVPHELIKGKVQVRTITIAGN